MNEKTNLNSHSSLNEDEVDKFAKLADEWWNPSGSLATLHAINSCRLEYILKQISNNFSNITLNDINLIDVGCGGGLVAEPLARLGLKVSAIDAAEQNILVAKAHALANNLQINYRNITVEAIQMERYDAVIALEILEHVDNLNHFIINCFNLVKPGGLLIFSSMNKTIRSYLESIVIAEYLLNWVPRGTHSWDKFVAPEQIINVLANYQHQLLDLSGLKYSILKKTWFINQNIANNYFIAIKKL